MRSSLAITVLLVAGLLAGCSSSSSSSSSSSASGATFPAQHAEAGEPGLAQQVHELDDGEEIALPMYQQGYTASDNPGAELVEPGENDGFTLRVGEDADSGRAFVSIETDDTTFTWGEADDDTLTIADGDFFLSAVRALDNDVDRTANLDSQYYDYVHFGTWQIEDYDHVNNVMDVRGAAFYQGLETHPDNMPTTGSATFNGRMIGQVIPAGTAEVHPLTGDVELTADFAGGGIDGTITVEQATFNESLSLDGAIHSGSNRFDGAVTAGPAGDSAAMSFSEGAEGDFDGRFFGPAAEEVGGAWSIEQDGRVGVGAFGGRE